MIDNFDYSETDTEIFQNDSVDIDTEHSYSFDAELDDKLIRTALSSPLFTQEREESANLRQTYHSHEESLLPAQSFFTRTSTGRPVYEPREELQKSHVLKAEELSRRKLTEDFEEVTSFFQDSNVKTVYIFGDNDAKYPDAQIDDDHTRNSLASPLYLQEREASASLLQVLSLTKRKLVSTCTVNFLQERGDPFSGCHKGVNLTKNWTTVRSGSLSEKQGNDCLQKQNPRSRDMNTERILPNIILVNWRDKLILKQWKLGIIEHHMNSPDENKLNFTKNEHDVILVLEVVKK